MIESVADIAAIDYPGTDTMIADADLADWMEQQQTLPLPLNITALVVEGLEGDEPEMTYQQQQGQQQQSPRGPGSWMLR